MKSVRTALLVLLPLLAHPVPADDLTRDAAIGGALGGALGGIIGADIGGRDGAIIGAGIGAAAGTAMTTGGHGTARETASRPVIILHQEERRKHGHGYHCPPGQAKYSIRQVHRGQRPRVRCVGHAVNTSL